MRDQKFYEQVKKAILYKTTDDRYLTLEEYKTANAEKADKKVYYTNDPKRQAASVALYTNRGIDVVVMDHIIDGNFQSFMEYSGGEEGLTFRACGRGRVRPAGRFRRGQGAESGDDSGDVPQGAGQG